MPKAALHANSLEGVPALKASAPVWWTAITRPRHELRLLLIALQFLTRVPVPAWVGWREDWRHQSARHFPLVGAWVGAFAAAVFWEAAHWWLATMAVLAARVQDFLADRAGLAQAPRLAVTHGGWPNAWLHVPVGAAMSICRAVRAPRRKPVVARSADADHSFIATRFSPRRSP